MYELTVRNHFDAAHFLPGYEGDCNNMHGHTWDVEVTYLVPTANQNDQGIAIDFKVLKATLNQILAHFDHRMVNQIIPIPTAENLAQYIYYKLSSPNFKITAPYLMSVTIHESRDAKVTYYIDPTEVEETNGD